jgi:hypothetical protein
MNTRTNLSCGGGAVRFRTLLMFFVGVRARVGVLPFESIVGILADGD